MSFRIGAPKAFSSSSDEEKENGFDFLSCDRIEERLENLKNKKSFRDWLNSQVAENDSDEDEDWMPGVDDDEDDDSDEEEIKTVQKQSLETEKHENGFFNSLFWTFLCIVNLPILSLYALCTKRSSNKINLPLGAKSVAELIKTSLTNCFSLLAIAFVFYWLLVNSLPEFNVSTTLQVFSLHLKNYVVDVQHFDWKISQANQYFLVKTSFFLLLCYCLFHFYKTWSRILIFIAMAYVFLASVFPYHDYFSPKPMIVSIKPTFAMVDEELMVSVDGKNLEEGGFVAWVPYWGCASISSIADCERQNEGILDRGMVTVTFSDIEHYIPCYKKPPNPLKMQTYDCFPEVRLRVKGQHSIPGWTEKKIEKKQHSKDEL